MTTKTNTLYRVMFANQNRMYEIYAKSVHQPDIYGFIQVGDIVFDTHSQVVVDPSEERLKMEFEGVKSFLIPMHAVIRIDEVEKQGTAKIRELDGSSNMAQFPMQMMTPSEPTKK